MYLKKKGAFVIVVTLVGASVGNASGGYVIYSIKIKHHTRERIFKFLPSVNSAKSVTQS